MYRIGGLLVFCAVGVVLIGCSDNPGRKTVRDLGWGTGAWGVYQNAKGENTPQIKAAVDTLRHSNDTSAKVCAANFLGSNRVSTNLVAEGCEAGMKNTQPMDVRLACARALSYIGSSTAIDHLRKAEDNGYIPVFRDYSVLDKYGAFPSTQPCNAPCAPLRPPRRADQHAALRPDEGSQAGQFVRVQQLTGSGFRTRRPRTGKCAEKTKNSRAFATSAVLRD